MSTPTASVLVNVTIEDILAGEVGKCEYCPIALAIKRVLPDSTYYVAVVDNFALVSTYPNHVAWPANRYLLPSEAVTFIRHFDSKAFPVYPFSFQMKLSAI